MVIPWGQIAAGAAAAAVAAAGTAVAQAGAGTSIGIARGAYKIGRFIDPDTSWKGNNPLKNAANRAKVGQAVSMLRLLVNALALICGGGSNVPLPGQPPQPPPGGGDRPGGEGPPDGASVPELIKQIDQAVRAVQDLRQAEVLARALTAAARPDSAPTIAGNIAQLAEASNNASPVGLGVLIPAPVFAGDKQDIDQSTGLSGSAPLPPATAELEGACAQGGMYTGSGERSGRIWTNSNCGTYANTYDGDGGGIADLNDGVLSFAIEKGEERRAARRCLPKLSTASGWMISALSKQNGSPAVPGNLDPFNSLVSQGMTPEQAAARTFTGKMGGSLWIYLGGCHCQMSKSCSGGDMYG
ncbi:hypothetical protein [Actinokineospora sp. UTMC 2448]|uniref:hypothetical protein n=1 Tax=Actinokineospora sp. UTMC 2448 TaxID=2268449 RepID=UPI0021648B1A|nr:hypothetical protein [Actinokineospora sp. UTMC 2448]